MAAWARSAAAEIRILKSEQESLQERVRRLGEDVQDEVRYGRSEEEGGSRLPDAEEDRHDQRSDQPRQWHADARQWQPSLETVII